MMFMSLKTLEHASALDRWTVPHRALGRLHYNPAPDQRQVSLVNVGVGHFPAIAVLHAGSGREGCVCWIAVMMAKGGGAWVSRLR
jgi:hypothetical protein